jgi:hypothetical protein
MIEGKKITLAELAARDQAKRLAEYQAQQAWEQTPEGAAWRAEQDAYHRRMAEADERHAIENPPLEDDEDGGDDDAENDGDE